jgi:hypothetical protein
MDSQGQSSKSCTHLMKVDRGELPALGRAPMALACLGQESRSGPLAERLGDALGSDP